MNLLPKELDYLELAAAELSKIPSSQLDECVEAPKLDEALRERVAGMTLSGAVRQLTDDSENLSAWLENGGHEPAPWAFWVEGFLGQPEMIARSLLAPRPPRMLPIATMEPPKGWQRRMTKSGLTFEEGDLFCVVMALDKSQFEARQHENQRREQLQASSANPWRAIGGQWSSSNFNAGQCNGIKSVYIQSGRARWKEVHYLVEVPGGYADVHVGRAKGKQFEETEVEAVLGTLRVSAPSAPDASSL